MHLRRVCRLAPAGRPSPTFAGRDAPTGQHRVERFQLLALLLALLVPATVLEHGARELEAHDG